MKTTDLMTTAVSNTFQSKTRSILTILSIFVGAFTLVITSGLGTGINAYIDDTLAAVGDVETLTVTKDPEFTERGPASQDGPQEFDPDQVETQSGGIRVAALNDADVEAIAAVDGITRVEPQRIISPDFIEADGSKQYVLTVSTLVGTQATTLAAGSAPDNSGTEYEVALPIAYVEPLGFASNEDAIGQEVRIGITDATQERQVITATVVGVAEDALASPTAASVLVNSAAQDALFEAQSIGLPEGTEPTYASAIAWFDPASTDEQLDVIKADLTAAGFSGSTVNDILGALTEFVNLMVLVLNGFAVIALVAAAFGIVNTLFMSVQERTREIGLMKAMGMGSGKIFSLFSLEALVIGFLGTVLGVGVAFGVGTALSSVLSGNVLADLPGLTLIAFSAMPILYIFALVLGIAFLASTLPAARAAKADPVDSLRYE